MSLPDESDDDWRFKDPEPEPSLFEDEPEAPPWVRGVLRRKAEAPSAPAIPSGFLKALSEAEDSLSRLDSATQAAPPSIQEGIAARMALQEAAGWLAHADAWIHPLDLALRDMGLTGSFLAAAISGRVRKEMPSTARSAGISGWNEEDPDSLPEDLVVGSALALARTLRRLATTTTFRPMSSAAGLQAALKPFGGAVDEGAFDAWKATWRRDIETNGPLLASLSAAGRWAEVEENVYVSGSLADRSLRCALVGAIAASASGRLRATPLPLWTSVPGQPAAAWRRNPSLSSDPATAIPVLQQIAEGSKVGLRELGRLLDAAHRAASLTSDLDKRSRLPDAVDAVLRVPAMTPTTLARRIKVTQQTANDLLRQLARAGVVREATGRKAFRAYAA